MRTGLNLAVLSLTRATVCLQEMRDSMKYQVE